ncbi:FtsW/RodA/SpoVE family cell cycle protein [Luteococcus sp. OSA5]|uniref:FtsW/RodA/SpoVE family cell cycle protein n=1 Tax=Luteococcus sp. OSA5 TaxID=3401630 RepID=UPI003B43AF25
MSTQSTARGHGDRFVYRRRRNVELFMDLFALALGLGGWLLVELNLFGKLPENLPMLAAGWFGLGLAAHAVVRWRLPYADPLILPCVLLLNGLGLAMIHRIDQVPLPEKEALHRADTQMLWTLLGVLLFALVIALLRDHRRLQRFPYLLFLLGLVMLLLPLVPGLGSSQGMGAQIWITIGPYSFQPAEIAKVVLAIAFAGYLTDRREVLALAGRRVLGIDFPRLRDLGPIIIMWLASLAILVFQNDLGSSMLFFGLFVVMLYVATEKPGWAVLGVGLIGVGGVLAYQFAGHVRVRFESWLRPFENYDQNTQVISAQFGLAWGGLTGRGWGMGRPALTTFSYSDMIATSLGEELGIVGLMGIILIYGIIVARGLRAALASHEAFGKLLACGLAFTFALQVFAIIGGATRLLPLTGLTTPFMSQGGSAMISNWVIVAILLVVSNQARRPSPTTMPSTDARFDNEDTLQIPVVRTDGSRRGEA